MKKGMGTLIFLTAMILVCSVAARLLTRGQTLSEYADANRDIAYATPKGTGEAVPLAENIKESPEAASPKQTSSTSVSSPARTPEAVMTSPDGNTSALPEDGIAPSSAPDSWQDLSPIEEETSDSVHYQDGFFYQPLTDRVIARITGISYPVKETLAPTRSLKVVNVVPDDEKLAVDYEDLRYLNVLYYDFNGEVQTGELICNKGIAQDLIEIFYELYLNEYQIEKIRLIDSYGGDDTASMLDNNTSCFNYRVVDGTNSLSKHALGCAIDINPFYNPYVVFNRNGSGETYISPSGSEKYADRTQNFPYKIDETDLCYKLFTARGFTWGGNWNSSKDYQHFQKVVN